MGPSKLAVPLQAGKAMLYKERQAGSSAVVSHEQLQDTMANAAVMCLCSLAVLHLQLGRPVPNATHLRSEHFPGELYLTLA